MASSVDFQSEKLKNETLREICRKMDEYNALKEQLIGLYREHKTINYDLLLSPNTNTLVSQIYTTLMSLLARNKISMGFVRDIGYYLGMQDLITKIESGFCPEELILELFNKHFLHNQYEEPTFKVEYQDTVEVVERFPKFLVINLESLKEYFLSHEVILVFYSNLSK